jgi:hypothetical protein
MQEKRPGQNPTESTQQPTVTITRQELDFLKHGAHQYIDSIGTNSTEGQKTKIPVGFRFMRTTSEPQP